MPQYKVTFFFQDNTNQTGWTESWWSTNTDGVSALTAWNPTFTARLALLMNYCQITEVRVANVDHPRDSIYAGYAPGTGTISNTSHPGCGPWDALLVRRDVAPLTLFGHVFMRGIPQAIFTGRVYGSADSYMATWTANFTTWRSALLAIPAQLRKGTTTPPTYPNMTDLFGIRRTERRVGRPFDALRGRRSVA
jgi:hypothetical protein